jgi:hypothetical protein
LDHLPKIEVAFELALLLDSLDDPFFVFEFSGFAVLLEDVVIVELGHLVGILKEVILQVHQLVLGNCLPLACLHLSD